MMAARLWWSLKYHGHPSPLILEGGFKNWENNGRETDAAEPCPLKVYAEFEGQQDSRLRADANDIVAALEKDVLIIDARTTAQHNGKVVNLAFSELLESIWWFMKQRKVFILLWLSRTRLLTAL